MANKKTKTPQELKNLRLFYVTTPSLNVARKISKILLHEKIVACTNILPKMESHYHWKGKIETSSECVLILKTSKKLSKILYKRVLELHPYEVPCVLEIPLESASAAYGQWLLMNLGT